MSSGSLWERAEATESVVRPSSQTHGTGRGRTSLVVREKDKEEKPLQAQPSALERALRSQKMAVRYCLPHR